MKFSAAMLHMLEGVKRHAAGEEILLKHLAHPENDDQRKWINDRLLALVQQRAGIGRAK